MVGVKTIWEDIKADSYCGSVRDGTHESPQFVEDGRLLITSKNIRNGRVILDTANLISEQDFTNINRRSKVDQWDVLFSMIGTVGEVCLVREEEPTFAIKNIGLFKVGDELKAKWLYYWLCSPIAQATIRQACRGASQQYIPLGELRKFQVRVPKKPGVMCKVVDNLSAYDDLIENNLRRIVLLEEASRLLYREWFVHFRFPGYEHVKIINGLPEGWEPRTLGDIASTNSESFRLKELPQELNYIDISSVAQGRIVSKNQMVSTEAPGRARRKARDGDVIWSNVRPNLRAYALVREPDHNDVFSTGFTVLSAIGVPFTWFYMLVTTDSFVGHLVNHATGVGYPAVRPDDFERASVVLPPAEVLKCFHESTESNFRLVTKLEQQNRKLAQARDLLLPRLMNGEIAV